jgi:hypothetical protein
MSVYNEAAAFRKAVLGDVSSKSTGTLAATTVPLFTIAGGLVAITSIVGRCTTAITVANSYKLQHNPTDGTTVDIFAATDIGTTDTAAGEIFVVTGLKTDTLVKGALGVTKPYLIADTGQIEHVSAGTDGALKWYVTWVPIDEGATLVAA